MSRAAAAGTVTATTSKPLYLFIKNTSHGPTLYASETNIPGSASINAVDFPTMNLMFALVREKAFLSRTNQDVFEHILSFLYCGIAAVLVEPENTKLTIHDRFPRLMTIKPCTIKIPRDYYLRQTPIKEAPGKLTKSFDPKIWDNFGRRLFDVSVTHRINLFLPQLLTNCLNAVEDLDKIRNILDKINPELRAVLLCAEGTATITHLEALNPGHSFTRTGTALQMAIYADDEGVQALLKEYMDPAEFERQAIEAFSTVLPDDVKQRLAAENAPAVKYLQEADAQQKADAENLCAGLEAAMRAAVPTDFICAAPNYIASTTSESVNAAVVKFKQDLLDYTQKNPLHNRYILERLYEINASLEGRSHCFGRDCFLSQQGITEAQLLMSERWVQHYARGPYYIAENRDELALRSSTCRDTTPPIDIHSVMSRLRSDGRCLDILASRVGEARGGRGGGARIKSCVEQKQHAIGTCYAARASKCPQA